MWSCTFLRALKLKNDPLAEKSKAVQSFQISKCCSLIKCTWPGQITHLTKILPTICSEIYQDYKRIGSSYLDLCVLGFYCLSSGMSITRAQTYILRRWLKRCIPPPTTEKATFKLNCVYPNPMGLTLAKVQFVSSSLIKWRNFERERADE